MKAYQKLITRRLLDFRRKRKWSKFHIPADLARAVMIEAAELNELFLWGKEPPIERLKEEIADVFIYLLGISEILGIDLEKEILAKVEKNKNRVRKKLPN